MKSVHNLAPLVLIQACDNHTASVSQNLFHHVVGGVPSPAQCIIISLFIKGFDTYLTKFKIEAIVRTLFLNLESSWELLLQLLDIRYCFLRQ